jgi:hypothetical protein
MSRMSHQPVTSVTAVTGVVAANNDLIVLSPFRRRTRRPRRPQYRRPNEQLSGERQRLVIMAEQSTEWHYSRDISTIQGLSSAPTSSPIRVSERPHAPTRSSTYGSPRPDSNQPAHDLKPHARSEDLSHGGSSDGPAYPETTPRPSPTFLSSGSRPTTPADSNTRPSSSGHSDEEDPHPSAISHSSTNSASSSHSGSTRPGLTSMASTSTSLPAS